MENDFMFLSWNDKEEFFKHIAVLVEEFVKEYEQIKIFLVYI